MNSSSVCFSSSMPTTLASASPESQATTSKSFSLFMCTQSSTFGSPMPKPPVSV